MLSHSTHIHILSSGHYYALHFNVTQMFDLKHLELASTQLSLSPEQKKVLLEVHRFPKFKSRAATKIIISLLEGDEFRDELGSFLKKMFRSGVPSLYNDICNLIRKQDMDTGRLVIVKDPAEFKTHPLTTLIMSVVDSFISNLRSNGTFGGGDDPKETPQSLLWALFVKSHILDKSGDLKEALVVIDECLVHTPSALDMYIKKGMIMYFVKIREHICNLFTPTYNSCAILSYRAYFAQAR